MAASSAAAAKPINSSSPMKSPGPSNTQRARPAISSTFSPSATALRANTSKNRRVAATANSPASTASPNM